MSNARAYSMRSCSALLILAAMQLGSSSLHAQSPEGIVRWSSPLYGNNAYGPPLIGHDYLDVSISTTNIIALRTDGTIVVTGADYVNMLSPPAPTPGNPFIRVFAGSKFGVAMREDRTLVGWGTATADLNKPPPGQFMDVSCGAGNGLGLRLDGTLVCWGWKYPYPGPPIYGSLLDVPPGTFKAIACGNYHCLALRDDNALIGWGYYYGFMDDAPTGEFKAIGASLANNIALRSDGTVVAWGSPNTGIIETVPPGPFVAIDSDMFIHTAAALRKDGTIAMWGMGVPEGYSPPKGTFSRVSVTSHTSVALGSPACSPDCQADGELNIDDFICFQTLFAFGESWADCDGDGQLLIDDFICFQTAYAIGC